MKRVTVNGRVTTPTSTDAEARYPVEQRVGESVVEQLRPVTRPRLYEVIVEQLCAYIADNEMIPGDRLPAERDLAAKLGVSRASLSQALVASKYRASCPCDTETARFSSAARRGAAIKALREHADRIPDIIEAREALEVKLAGLAAARRTDAEMAAIDAAIAKMESEIDAGDRGDSATRCSTRRAPPRRTRRCSPSSWMKSPA